MSYWHKKRTFHPSKLMSAFGGKADIDQWLPTASENPQNVLMPRMYHRSCLGMPPVQRKTPDDAGAFHLMRKKADQPLARIGALARIPTHGVENQNPRPQLHASGAVSSR